MKPNYCTQRVSILGRWIATSLFCLSAIAFVWQGAFFHDTAAMASPVANLVASTDAGNQIKGKAREDAGNAKGLIRDAKNQVKKTANKNADRVEEATDGKGSFFARKANRDKARIEKRAEEDASRTQKAVDNTKNAVERTVDNIKDTIAK
ncbi:hypothetical protein [Brunnivagina elsteri]|uniref:Uncharacterized protein n=1 Tax=Brunnivagina elsteri CCALA 953 TaxID=987040 RepID=A0A2A2TBR2_9CYAN|nr:hypothetical protein [Calothrix elsteri]PAX51152.1 hypothetical protein CK510_26360 [Calothrix elsteri CCALA 953]